MHTLVARFRRRYRTRGGPDCGAAAVELALLLPVLLLIVCGIIDFARMYNTQIALSQAAREGVRPLALGTVSNPTAKVLAAAFPVTGETVTYTGCPATVTATSVATVTVTKTYSYITPLSGFLSLVGGSALAAPVITGQAEMRCGG